MTISLSNRPSRPARSRAAPRSIANWKPSPVRQGSGPRVHLSNGEHLDLYDTSGPYTDSGRRDRPRTPASPPRPGTSVRDRGTQLQRARAGEITAEMEFIAPARACPAELVRDEVAAGAR